MLPPRATPSWPQPSRSVPRSTPHLFIIDPRGGLVYAGGIDSVPSARADDIKTATNHMNQALGEVFAGRPVSAAVTKPCGCSIKYKS